jgi:predicted DNA-binding transcriptional regulator AlpA
MPRQTTSLVGARAAAQAKASAGQKLQFLSKVEVLDLVPVSYVTIWNWMRSGAFPRSRKVGGKIMWLKHEIDAWMASRPIAALKGDDVA